MFLATLEVSALGNLPHLRPTYESTWLAAKQMSNRLAKSWPPTSRSLDWLCKECSTETTKPVLAAKKAFIGYKTHAKPILAFKIGMLGMPCQPIFWLQILWLQLLWHCIKPNRLQCLQPRNLFERSKKHKNTRRKKTWHTLFNGLQLVPVIQLTPLTVYKGYTN